MMKKLYFLLLTLLSFTSFGQGLEDFTNSNATTSYSDNSFVGNNGITWTYVASRDGNLDTNSSGISLPAIMLRRVSDVSKITSSTISGGIGDFSVKLYKGFTGVGDRQVELFVNGISKGTSQTFDDFAEHVFSVSGINVAGNVVIEIVNSTSKQVIIDDITWSVPSTDPSIIVSGALSNLKYTFGNGPSAEQTFTVEGSNLTNDISVTAPTNFEISQTSGSGFGSSISLRQNSGSVSSTTIYARLAAGLAINTYGGDVTIASTGATDKTVALSGGVYEAPTNAMVITGVFDAMMGSSPRGIELLVIKNIPDLSIFGIESANNGGGINGQEFTFPSVAATAGQYIHIVGAGQEADFTAFFGASFTADYADMSMSINGNDAILLYENTFVIDVYGDPSVDGLGTNWDYTDGFAYRNADTGPSATFTATDWLLGNVGELEQATNASSSTDFPINSYTNTLGVSELQVIDGFALYPNPVRNGLVNIKSKSNTIKNITIFDVIGKQVIQKTTTKNQINISQLKSGLYFVKVQQDGKIVTRKLVVE